MRLAIHRFDRSAALVDGTVRLNNIVIVKVPYGRWRTASHCQAPNSIAYRGRKRTSPHLLQVRNFSSVRSNLLASWVMVLGVLLGPNPVLGRVSYNLLL